jgi:cytochrome c5
LALLGRVLATGVKRLALTLLAVAACCGVPPQRVQPRGQASTPSIFERTLAQAREGDPRSQNLLGFMLFFGQGAMVDVTSARFWFEVAAEGGSAEGQMNLALMYALGAGAPRDDSVAARYLREALVNPTRPRDLAPVGLDGLVVAACDAESVRPTSESQIFGTFCAGCHGMNGIADYAAAPSFALGESMDKTDEELTRAVVEGHRNMPQWGEKIRRSRIERALRHARGLAADLRYATLHTLHELPERAFLFGPMDPEYSIQRPERSLDIESPLPAFSDLCAARGDGR